MSRDKQIEEMRKDVASIHRFFFEDDDYEVLDDYIADMLFARGYRKVDDIFEDIFEGRLEVVNKRSGDKLKKASDVAEEIFAEIELEIHQLDFDREETRAIAIEGIIANAKKKYIGRDTNVTTNTEDK